MKKQTTKQILILFLIIIVVLLCLHYAAFSFIRGAGMKVVNLERDVETLQVQVSEFSKYSVDDIRSFAAAIKSRFVPKDDFVAFLEMIETQARSQGLEITVRGVDVESRSDDPNDDKEILRLQIETGGSWQDTMRFVSYIEYLPYKISVRDLGLTVNPEGEESAPVEWRGRIEMTALKFK